MERINILTMDAESGISLVNRKGGNTIFALVSGKLYRTTDYRPIDGNGRQLRNDSQTAIIKMMSKAREVLAECNEEDAQQGEPQIIEKVVEKIVEVPTPPKEDGSSDLMRLFTSTLAQLSSDKVVESALPIIEKKLIEEFGCKPIVHEIHVGAKVEQLKNEILHEKFDIILAMLTDKRTDRAVYLFGDAGTGKSYIAEQASRALNIPYFYASSLSDEIALKGFVDANGNYQSTPFYHAFKDGGLFLLDELDASGSDVAIQINNAIASRRYAFPNGEMLTAHDDFCVIATGNTSGKGASDVYTARNHIDESTLDRFVFVPVDYDIRIENAMANGDNDLVAFCRDFRAVCKTSGVSCLCTYRAEKRLSSMVDHCSAEDAITYGLLKGLPQDDARIVAQKMTKGGKWLTALKAVSGI